MKALPVLAVSLVSALTFAASAQPAPSEVWTSCVDGRAKSMIFKEVRDLLVKAQSEERAGLLLGGARGIRAP